MNSCRIYAGAYNGFKTINARRGRASVIYSDNAKTFAAASKWIDKINRDENMQGHLIKKQIKWKFNLSRTLWWGRRFKRMVGLVKQCLLKATGRANLTKKELEDILLDIEIVLNNQPVIYIEKDRFDIKYFVLWVTYTDSRRAAS